MVEACITLANDEIADVRAWIEDQDERLIEEMIAPVVTETSNRANVVFRVLNALDARLADFQLHLARLEKEHDERK